MRRTFPMLDPWSSCHSNDKPSSSSSSFPNHRIMIRKEEKLNAHDSKKLCSPVISPPLSEEEEDSNSTTSSNTEGQKRQCLSSFQRINSEDSSQNGTPSEFETEASNIEQTPVQKRVSFLNLPTQSKESNKGSNSSSSSSSMQAPDCPLATSESTYLEDESSTRETVVEALGMETSHHVVTTAASVLLLMRFSVTDQALDCLTTKPTTSMNNTNEKVDRPTNANQEVVSKKRNRPLPAKVVHPVTPTITRSIMPMPLPEHVEEILVRRVSVPDNSSQQQCPNRLSMPEDPNELNSLHCFVRAQLLEVFSLPPQKDKPGRVGLRCIFCAHLPRKDRTGTTMCTFYPKSLQDLYRSVMTWQRIHFRLCKHVPKTMQEEYWKHKESDQTRGKTTYWVTSAMRLGLEDISNGRNGIYFVQPAADGAGRDSDGGHAS